MIIRLFFLSIFCFLICSAQEQIFPDNTNVVGRWKFANSVNDDQGHTIYTNGTIAYITGYRSNSTALDFNGSDTHIGISNPNAADFDFGADESFTIAVLIKFDSHASAIIHHRVGTDGWGTATHASELMYERYGDGTANVATTIGSTTLTAGTWYVLHFVFDTAQDSIIGYINGAWTGNVDISSVTGDPANGGDLLIGFFGAGRLDGLIDEIIVYDQIKTAAEIASDYEYIINPPSQFRGKDDFIEYADSYLFF